MKLRSLSGRLQYRLDAVRAIAHSGYGIVNVARGLEDSPAPFRIEMDAGETPAQAKERARSVFHTRWLDYHPRRYVLIEVTGAAPKIAGWSFVAVLQHLKGARQGGRQTALQATPDGQAGGARGRRIGGRCATGRPRRVGGDGVVERYNPVPHDAP